MYLKQGEQIRIAVHCHNKTITIQKNSRLEIAVLGKYLYKARFFIAKIFILGTNLEEMAHQLFTNFFHSASTIYFLSTQR